ncbi:predicted protein [Histoplasma capsulatum G186AR]|uniref:Secreted protein n=1 Tax=Ajellomyces capsulatus (strain G186AR / H82 / ATCC MYA-2454 / RMSCC 2432) TaxID=447093 RepID=C0NC10_AJECG|nr:uncharacterized protein HCBG_00656 [Histoplasma capsulatum G186AR]EEH11201.1 predicted protein [Histoplasma capsulatum G186AR]
MYDAVILHGHGSLFRVLLLFLPTNLQDTHAYRNHIVVFLVEGNPLGTQGNRSQGGRRWGLVRLVPGRYAGEERITPLDLLGVQVSYQHVCLPTRPSWTGAESRVVF